MRLALTIGCLAALLLAAGATPRGAAGADAGGAAGETCPEPVQPMLDGTPAGGTATLPGCIIRETLTIARPMTVRGVAGTEIRGSDVWTDWTPAGNAWRSGPALPVMHAHGECLPDAPRCLWPEQAFRDGVALEQVDDEPGPGQFRVDADRHVRLGDDPAGHVIEVSVRPRWVAIEADGVTIEGLAMRHATNDSQSGALGDDGHAIVVRDATLSDAHGANVWLTGRSELLDSDVARAGQLGVGVGGARVAGNRIHDNGTEGFDPGWEAGGFKAVTHDVVIEDNEVDHNAGSGIWFDGNSSGVVVRENRVHDNDRVGIFIEISSDVRVTGNTAWHNGDGDQGWLNGAGILVHSSTDVEVDHNLVAWNADGIGVESQQRHDRPAGAATDIHVHDNTIVQTDGPDTRISLGWAEDWAGPLFDPASGNDGTGNRFWYPVPEGHAYRFAWNGPIRGIGPFAATPGGQESAYLSDSAARALLREHDVPAEPGAPIPFDDGTFGPLSQGDQLTIVGLLLIALLLASVVAGGMGVIPRRPLLVAVPLACAGYVLLLVEVQRIDLVPDPVQGLAFVATVAVEVAALAVVLARIARGVRERRRRTA